MSGYPETLGVQRQDHERSKVVLEPSRAVDLASAVRPIVRHHHERLDGTGYPDGLRGDAVPLLAQIISIVDEYDAITTSRPYRQALSPERAFDELYKDVTRGLLNPDLVDIFSAVGEQKIFDTAAAADALAADMATNGN